MFGEKISDVSAHLEDGVMTATIHTPDDTFHVEVIEYSCSPLQQEWSQLLIRILIKEYKICQSA